MYIGRAYEKIVPTRDRYKRGLVKLPKPEFYTFYNGIEKEEPFVDVTIHGIGPDVNSEKDMELSFMDSSGEVYAVLIISKRYED